MQVLQKLQRERTSTRPTQQYLTFQMQLQQKVEGMYAVVGMK